MSFDITGTVSSKEIGDIIVELEGGSYNACNDPEYGKDYEHYEVFVYNTKTGEASFQKTHLSKEEGIRLYNQKVKSYIAKSKPKLIRSSVQDSTKPPEGYAWIITHDYTPSLTDYVGLIGPENAQFTKAQILKGKAFRMKNKYGEICFRGRIIGDYDGLEPLNDFGMQIKCTEIWYHKKG